MSSTSMPLADPVTMPIRQLALLNHAAICSTSLEAVFRQSEMIGVLSCATGKIRKPRSINSNAWSSTVDTLFILIPGGGNDFDGERYVRRPRRRGAHDRIDLTGRPSGLA